MVSDLIIKDLNKRFKKVKVLDNINIEVKSGDIVGIVGLNGSGKTTLFKCILGLYKYEGEIIVLGNSEVNEEVKDIGFMIENASLFLDMSAKDNLLYWSKFYGTSKERVVEVLDLIGLSEDKKKVKSYSLGMKQRLAFGIAILNKPKLLILDEPTNAMDLKNIVNIRNILLSMKDTTILIASHDVNELCKICSSVILMKDGKVVDTISRFKVKGDFEELILERLGL